MKLKLSTLMNIILSVVLLTSMFYVGITSSQGVYDPWCDQDSDGDIDIYDIVPAASAYGTTGNPTRNVTIVHNTYEFLEDFNFTEHSAHSYRFTTKGYRQVTLYVFLVYPVLEDTEVRVSVSFWIEGSNFAPTMDVFTVFRFQNASVWRTYDVKGSSMSLIVLNPTDHFASGRVALYMTT